MIKHLGQKITSPKAGTTTMMRAAISNARQDMVSKDKNIKIDKLPGVKKGYRLKTELGSLFDRTPTVRSIYDISSSGQAVEYLVGTKLVVLAPQYQASAVTYDPAQNIANLEAQVELLKYKIQTYELLSKAKEISSNLEQKMSVNAKKVSIIIESDTLLPQSVSGSELKIWVHMTGSPDEKMVYIPSGANAEEINFEIRRQLELSRDVPEIRVMFKRDGRYINLASEPDITIDDIVGTIERLSVVPEMAMWGDKSIGSSVRDDTESKIYNSLNAMGGAKFRHYLQRSVSYNDMFDFGNKIDRIYQSVANGLSDGNLYEYTYNLWLNTFNKEFSYLPEKIRSEIWDTTFKPMVFEGKILFPINSYLILKLKI